MEFDLAKINTFSKRMRESFGTNRSERNVLVSMNWGQEKNTRTGNNEDKEVDVREKGLEEVRSVECAGTAREEP